MIRQAHADLIDEQTDSNTAERRNELRHVKIMPKEKADGGARNLIHRKPEPVKVLYRERPIRHFRAHGFNGFEVSIGVSKRVRQKERAQDSRNARGERQ